jgi:hypothetical protein
LALLLQLRLLPALHRTGLGKAALLQANQQQYDSSKLFEHLFNKPRYMSCLKLLAAACWRPWLLTPVVGSWLQQQKALIAEQSQADPLRGT